MILNVDVVWFISSNHRPREGVFDALDSSERPQVTCFLPEFFFNRPDFDAPQSRRRPARGHLKGFVQVPGFYQKESPELFLCLCEGAVGEGEFAGPDPDGRGRMVLHSFSRSARREIDNPGWYFF